MALPRFLYSTSDSVQEQLLPTSENREAGKGAGAICVSPSSKNDLTGAMTMNKKELANNPNLRPSFVGHLSSPEASDDEQKEALRRERGVGNRREWEFGGAAVELELSEAGQGGGGGAAAARARDSGSRPSDRGGSSSDSDESGILETMGERRPSKSRGKRGSVSDRDVDSANKKLIGINDGVSYSQSTARRSVLLSDPGDYVYYQGDEARTKWEEAALYIREGEDNAKFFHHPRGRWSKLAFNILHHPAYYITHLALTILLMLLALLEAPPTSVELEPGARTAILSVHGVTEVLILTFLGGDIILRYMWFRARQFFSHKRTIFITIILAVMYVEAVTVLVRQQNHFRITRALRPFLFIDNYLMNGVRRVLRQIFQSFKPIIDVLLLLLFFICIFSLLSYFVFAEIDPSYFLNFKRSFVSMFIAMTTANHPDVMMEAYFERYASPLFFIVYMVVTVYCINNVLLAVVYSSFSNANRKKFQKLFLHKRYALRLAYNTLASTARGIEFHDFLAFMRYYRPRFPEWQVMCIFKALHQDPKHQHQELSLDEFYCFYEVRDLRWKQVREDGEVIRWFIHLPKLLRLPIKGCYRLVKFRAFNIIINLIVLLNLVFLIIYTLAVDGETVEDSKARFTKLHRVLPVSFIFVVVYIIEIALRIIGVGFYDYFRKVWNSMDFVVIMASFICLILEVKFIFLALWRPVKLFRLLRLKQRHRDIMDTLVVLVPRLISVAVLLVVTYYFFAIIGIETLNGRVNEGCCNDSWYDVQTYYNGIYRQNTSSVDIPPSPNVYYILNFDNILRSYVTLFCLMVVNNWYIIMEGFASQVGANDWLARIYFMSFIVITLVMLQVVISFIVEAFVFKIQAREKSRECMKHHTLRSICGCTEVVSHKKTVIIKLVPADIIKLKYEVTYSNERQSRFDVSNSIMRMKRTDLPDTGSVSYLGRRRKTKDDIQLEMYRKHLTDWINEEEKEKEALLQSSTRTPAKNKWLKKIWTWSIKFVEYVIE